MGNMITTVRSITPDSETTLATFEMVDGKLVADYASPGFQREMETMGIFLMGEELFPSDGLAFLTALPKVYSRSSTIRVETA